MISADGAGCYIGNTSTGNVFLAVRESQSASALTLISARKWQEYIGQWVFVAGEVDYANDTGRIYINGKLTDQGAMAFTGTSYSDTGNPIIRVSANTSETHAIDSARIYNRSLSAAEHYQLFLDNAPRNGLVAEFLFDSDTTNCQDTSGNGFHATWSGISAANYVQEI